MFAQRMGLVAQFLLSDWGTTAEQPAVLVGIEVVAAIIACSETIARGFVVAAAAVAVAVAAVVVQTD